MQPGDEYERLVAAINAEKSTMRDFFWICLYTGARKSNVKTMRFDEISFDLCTWKISGCATKNTQSITIPLSREAMALLRLRQKSIKSSWVFPGRFGGHIASVGSA